MIEKNIQENKKSLFGFFYFKPFKLYLVKYKINKIMKLEDIDKKNPFTVPDNYFDNFYGRLQMKIEQEPVIKQKVYYLNFLKPALKMVAIFILVFSLTYQVDYKSNTNTDDMYYSSLVEGIDEESFYSLMETTDDEGEYSTEELENYITENISEYELFIMFE